MKFTIYIFLFLFSGELAAQPEVITLKIPKKAKYPYSQVEPSICINPANTNEIIAGSVMNDYYYSIDGGKSWNSKSIKCKWGVHGDPCMLIDTLGRYYFFHLSNVKNGGRLMGGMICQRSDVIEGKFKQKLCGRTEVIGKFDDKEWAVVNPYNNHIYMCWTQFDAYDSDLPMDLSHILFSKSVDGGLTWSSSKQVSNVAGDCLDNDKTVEGAVPAVGPNGEIYVSWARNDTLWFNYSLDEGESWMKSETMIARQPHGWVFSVPRIYRCNGLPITACDRSNSSFRGNVYVNWGDQRNGIGNSDIWLVKSTDGGKTWTEPKKVNTDNEKKHQFFSWMTIDQTNGNLYFVFYDRRNHKMAKTDVYLARSTDGGETFQNYKISKSPFLPSKDVFFGDYTNISVHNGVIRPIWTRLNEGKISLHVALINDSDLD
ncbi:exo-alpha-sialidase [Crocinitomix catalasitica]|nr:exo-alpha-sialidase [Crocinitomix catalasitica]